MANKEELERLRKDEFLARMREGVSIREASNRMRINVSVVTKWRGYDKEFGAAVERALIDTAGIRQAAQIAKSRAGHRITRLPRSSKPHGLKKIPRYIDPFLDALAHGASPTRAAEIAEVSFDTVHSWKRDDPDFAERWAQALAQGNDRLEDEAWRRAVEGANPRPIFDKEGRQVCVVRDYSDTLLGQMLRGRKPEVYNRPDLSLSTKVEVRLTREQALERMQQFGLPVPQLTAEFEDDVDRTNDGSDRKQ